MLGGSLAAAVALSVAGCQPAEQEPSRITLSGVLCADEEIACGDDCVRPASDPDHCGGCDQPCGASELCDLGDCRPATEGCSEGRLACTRACVDSLSHPDHCGGCDQPCAPEAECAGGSCLCPGALDACGALCVDLTSDEQHCGGCDQACVDAQSCEGGTCECPDDGTLCDDRCVDLQSDVAHCGACGAGCADGQICDGGTCECPDDGFLCADGCADLQADVANCGECGNACTGGQVCDAGECACPEGQALCDGQCIDVLFDDDNCGGCGISCGLGQGCDAGRCASGVLGEDGCQGVVSDLRIAQLAAYQTVKVELAQDGQWVDDRRSEIVAGRPTLVRAFVEPEDGWVERDLSARLHLQVGDVATTVYSTSILSIAQASQEDDRESAFEFQVAGEQITPDTELVVEVVECAAEPEAPVDLPGIDGAAGEAADPPGGGVPAAADGLTIDATGLDGGDAPDEPAGARFPEVDSQPLDALDTGGLRIHVVPVRSNGRLPDLTEDGLGIYERAFLATYPVASVELTVGDPLDIDNPQDWNTTLDRVRALRQQQAPDPDVYYYGMVRPTDRFGQFCGGGCVAGVGFVPNGRFQNANQRVAVGLAYSDATSAFTMLHEVAHNHGRPHAPCAPGGNIQGVDPNYPYNGGVIGVPGYSTATDQLIPLNFTDVMGYCGNQWLSDYTYNGLLNTVVTLNQVQASVQVPAERVGSWRVLLWDAAHGARWGTPIPGPAEAMGEVEPANVLDATGQAIGMVSVYRTEVADLGYSVQVPEPEPGWHAIEIAGAEPLAY